MGDTLGQEDIQGSFLRAQESAVIEIADQGLLSLSQLVESGAIDVAPRFQRRDRWNAEKQSLLIESFLVNIPVPPVYLAEDAARIGSYAVIDGKQRLTAVGAFLKDKLALKGLTRLPLLNGLRYSELPEGVRNAIAMKSLRVTTLLRQSNEDLKHEVFLRLNTGGEILNAQEIRNVAYRGPLNDLVYELSENEFLRRQFKVAPPLSPAYKNMTDAEMVLRYLALRQRWKTFRGDIRDELDDFMLENRHSTPSTLREASRGFHRVFTAAEEIWGTQAFKRPGRDQALAGLFDAQTIALDGFDEAAIAALTERKSEVVARSAELFNDRRFDEAVRQATNTPARLRYRVEAQTQVFSNVLGL